MKDVNSGDEWNWSKVSMEILDRIVQKIKVTPFSFVAKGEDRLAWKALSHGDFELKSEYQIATNGDVNCTPFPGQWVWKVNTLPKIQSFVWRCYHNGIGTRMCLARRGIQIDPMCPLCQFEPESIIHTLRDCEVVKNFWGYLKGEDFNSGFFLGNIQEWLSSNGHI